MNTSGGCKASVVYTTSSDSSHQQWTIQKLNGKNYTQWSRSAIISIRGRGKIGYITGSVKEPKKEDEYQHHTWETDNSLVPTFLFHRTAKGLWDAVKEMYSDLENSAEVFELKSKVRDLRQGTWGSLNITACYQSFGKNSICSIPSCGSVLTMACSIGKPLKKRGRLIFLQD